MKVALLIGGLLGIGVSVILGISLAFAFGFASGIAYTIVVVTWHDR